MPRIIGVDIPEHKKVLYALQSIYGIGPKVAADILTEANIDQHKRARDLNQSELNQIQRIIERFNVEGDLRRIVSDNIDRLKRVRAYRGLRHAAGLPARGQRTRTNSRSARGGGKRRTVGSMTKEMAAKLEAAKK